MPSNHLSALCLPASCLAAAPLLRMLLFFDRLSCYQPAEGPPPDRGMPAGSDLLQSYPPAPLGEDLGRFLLLLKDMQNHAGLYLQAHLAALSPAERERAETDWRRMATMLKGAEPARPSADGLWRARLYLALAEIHAARQREISSGLASIKRQEQLLLKELMGEEEEIERILNQGGLELDHHEAEFPPGHLERLLTAWGRLYLADGNPERPWLLTTARKEEAQLLSSQYGRLAGRAPERILTLTLPPVSPQADYHEQRSSMRQALREPLAGIRALLEKAAFSDAAPVFTDQAAALELADAWNGLCGQPSSPAPWLTFLRMPGHSFPSLFARLDAQEPQEPQEPPAAPFSPHGLVAVLTEERFEIAEGS